jgi:acyl-CoA synthetase (AMP-forming)/AMP-acid ligase II
VTGDCGEIDENNCLSITGRKKDLIIHGGINVSPKAVENVLVQFPGIKEAAVIGKKHAFWGEEVVAFVVLDAGQNFDQPVIRQHCADRLNPDAVPTAFHVVSDLPRSSTGKIQKHLLRERA